MPISINTFVSALDTPSSLIPFFVKDAFDVTGRTVMANNEGGKHEAREKFIEEAGTSAFWIGGIPAFIAIANKMAKGKLDTDIHFKRINSKGVQGYFSEKKDGIEIGGAKLKAIQKELANAGSKYEKFHVGVTTAAVLTNLFMLVVAVPMFNQFLSRKLIAKEINKKNTNIDLNNADVTSFSSNKQMTSARFFNGKKKTNPSFGSFASLKDFFDVKKLLDFKSVAESAQLNVTSSMLLLDYGISGSRTTFIPRDNNERIEYAVKEGGIILFFYYAADFLKSGLAKVANKMFKTPIDLDYKIITDKEFLNKLKNITDKNKLFKFATVKKTNKNAEFEVIKFIDQELAEISKKKGADIAKESVFDNFTLKMAQKQGLIDIEHDAELGKWIRHSKKYIETEKLLDLSEHLNTFYEQALTQKGAKMENIISKTKIAKQFAIFSNMAICCVSLAYILPKIQYLIREHRTKTKSAPGVMVYEDMAKKKMIK